MAVEDLKSILPPDTYIILPDGSPKDIDNYLNIPAISSNAINDSNINNNNSNGNDNDNKSDNEDNNNGSNNDDSENDGVYECVDVANGDSIDDGVGDRYNTKKDNNKSTKSNNLLKRKTNQQNN